jgi:transketolase
MDAVQKAKSGHPGMPMGMAPAAYVLWTEFLKHNPANPGWVNRDRFVLSAGHGSTLLYGLLHLTGYPLSLSDLKAFRQWGSPTPGHPEYGLTAGVEVTTGPLGQGVANAVGMAIAERALAATFNRETFPIIDYKVYVIAGDGCLEEGVSGEASSLAGHLRLANLIVLYDDNRITIDGPTSLSFSEDVAKRYEAYGWHVQTVEGDGNDLAAIRAAIDAARTEAGRPSLIKIRTHIGYGSPNKQDSAEVHGSPLGEEEVARTKVRYGWNPAETFVVPPAALQRFRAALDLGANREREWESLLDRYTAQHPVEAAVLRRAMAGELPEDWESIWASAAPRFDPAGSIATREAQGKVLDAIMPRLPLVIGGSADLTPSNNTRFAGAKDFSPEDPSGRYIRYGVREHAMGAIMNGIAVSRLLIPYGATFFVFSDYMRPAVRLAALSGYPSIFVFTHDSIGLGEDGPTHQPVEQLAAMRAIPGLVTIRPADANETAAAWRFALERRDGPTALALTRQKVPTIDQSRFPPATNLVKGAYVMVDAPNARLILLATGSEVSLAVDAAAILAKEGIPARVVNMPSWELFEGQPQEYRDEVLPPAIQARVAVEAGVRLGWERYIGASGAFIGMSSFGASAPANVAFREFGITSEAVAAAARKVAR